jgi:hypothetical protein
MKGDRLRGFLALTTTEQKHGVLQPTLFNWNLVPRFENLEISGESSLTSLTWKKVWILGV